jgi:hypothetical protein
MLPYLHIATARASRPPYHHAHSSPPYLLTSASLRPKRASRAPCLYVATPSVPPELQSSIPPRPCTCSAPPELQASMPLCLHVPTPAAPI